MGWGLKDQADLRARRFFDVESADELTYQDIINAERLLGTSPRDHLPWGPRGMISPWESEESKMQAGLLGLGDSAEADWYRSLPYDAVIGMSGLLRDGLKKLSPSLVDAVDGVDQKLFGLTGGLLGTPRNITPWEQIELRSEYEKESGSPDYRGSEYGVPVKGRDPRGMK